MEVDEGGGFVPGSGRLPLIVHGDYANRAPVRHQAGEPERRKWKTVLSDRLMKFASVHAAFLRERACLASCAAVGAWVRLHAYAAELERAGSIPIPEHSDRYWTRVAQVTADEVEQAIAAGLCSRVGEVLKVEGYDLKGQRAVEARRQSGKRGGRPATKRNNINVVKPNGSTHVKPLSSPLLSSPLPSSPLQEEDQTLRGGALTRALIAAFCDRWKVKYGSAYIVQKKDVGAVERLKVRPEEWIAIADRYLADTTPFHVNRRHPLEHVANNPNEFTGPKETALMRTGPIATKEQITAAAAVRFMERHK